MKWLGRISIILAFISLATLTALPYLEPVRQKWERFKAAWELVNSNSPLAEEIDADLPESEKPATVRERSILLPDTNSVETSLSSTENEDPFLSEARRRARENPEAAMAWLQTEAAGKDRLRGMLEVIALWAAEDAENALLWLESNAQGVARIEALYSGIELWSQQDPVAAASWIDGMVNDGSKLSAARTLAANWVNQNPEDASKWVSQLPPGNLRSSTAEALVESWATADPKAAAIWAFSEAEFNGDVELFNQSIQYYAEADPEEAGQLLRAVTEAHEAPGSVDAYVRTLAQQDPVEAISWQAKLSPEDPLNQPENLETILQEWSRTDSVAASTWLSEVQPGPQRDAAIVGFTTTISEFDPEVAVAWSNSISDPNKRVETLKRSIQSWTETQPEQAREWVNTAEMEPGLRSVLSEMINAD
jgi:hypothetical protein